MATHTLDLAAFRALFPEFVDPPYSDALLTLYWDIATCAISSVDNCAISGKCLENALYLMLAHIATILQKATASGGTSAVGVKTGATVDKVSVTYSAPPFNSGWQSWLAQTPYGLTLWALLSALSAGGAYIGGLPETDAIRKVYGVF